MTAAKPDASRPEHLTTETPPDDPRLSAEIAHFAALKERFRSMYKDLQNDPNYVHTSVIVPSLSVNQEELAKVLGASYYEERLMFALIRLRNPGARLIYVTSQPVKQEVVDYYLQMLDGVPFSHARSRLHLLSTCDGSARPLTAKILERPRLLQRLRDLIGDPQRSYLTCYNSTVLERRLAVELDIPLNGADPSLLHLGTKSGSRKVFTEAGVNHPIGYEDLHHEDEIVAALQRLATERPQLRRAVVKLNEGFSGEGNGVFTFPEARHDEAALRAALHRLEWSSGTENDASFLRKFAEMGGIVEEMVEADVTRSPSVQMRVLPDGQSHLVSSHEQILGGSTGQVYLGCRFPASDNYRDTLHDEATRIGRVLADYGVVGRFGIDFLTCRGDDGSWQSYAIEINLRMGGTTPPFHALEFLTCGTMEAATGLFHTPDGHLKYYTATDNLKSAAYRGLLPEDLFDIVTRYDLSYRHSTGTGVLFYMIGALSQYGKLGMTCIGNTPEEAQALYERVAQVLDNETGADSHGTAAPLLDRYVTIE